MESGIAVTVLGLSGAGKTALVHSACNNQSEIFPTAGVQVSYIASTSRPLLVYDCSGQGSARSNWQLFANLSSSVCFVLDAHSVGTFHLAKKHLMLFLSRNKFMKKKNLCVMLNKCDLKNPPKQLLVRALEVEKIGRLVGRWYVKETSAFNKEGIEECLEWVIKNQGESG